jgi:hypothetical protein
MEAKEEAKKLSSALRSLEELKGSDYVFISQAAKVMCAWIDGMLEQLELPAQVQKKS